MKTRIVALSAVAFAGTWISAWAQIPMLPGNRIVGTNVYTQQTSPLWFDLTKKVTEDCSSIKVRSVGPKSLSCAVYKDMLDDGGRYGVYHIIGEEYVKTILIYNHPAHDTLTTGAVIYEAHYLRPGETRASKSILAMRAPNWRTNDVVLEAYDCGLPDTPENRKLAGIYVPTPEENAAALKAIEEQRRLPQKRAAEAAAARKQAADAKVLKWNLEQAAKGDSFGLLRMGQRYRDGDGVEKDLAKAREYFKKAAEAGSSNAEAELSKLAEATK